MVYNLLPDQLRSPLLMILFVMLPFSVPGLTRFAFAQGSPVETTTASSATPPSLSDTERAPLDSFNQSSCDPVNDRVTLAFLDGYLFFANDYNYELHSPLELNNRRKYCLRDVGHFNDEGLVPLPSGGSSISNIFASTFVLPLPPPFPQFPQFTEDSFVFPFDWFQSRAEAAYNAQVNALVLADKFTRRFWIPALHRSKVSPGAFNRGYHLMRPKRFENDPSKRLTIRIEEWFNGLGWPTITFSQNRLNLPNNVPSSGNSNAFAAAFDRFAVVGDYAELKMDHLQEALTPPMSEADFNWLDSVSPALYDGYSEYFAFRFEGNTDQLLRDYLVIRRLLSTSPLCTTLENVYNAPVNYTLCDQGWSVVPGLVFAEHLYNPAALGAFPFHTTFWGGSSDPGFADRAGFWVISLGMRLREMAGLSWESIDALYLTTHSMLYTEASNISEDKLPLRAFAQVLLRASAELWPDPENPTQSVYYPEIAHALRVSGIAVDAALDCGMFNPATGPEVLYNCTNGPGAVALGSAVFGNELASPFHLSAVAENPSNFGYGTTLPQVTPKRPDLTDAEKFYNVVYTYRNRLIAPLVRNEDYVMYTMLPGSYYTEMGPNSPYQSGAVITSSKTLPLSEFTISSECEPADQEGEPCYYFTGSELSGLTIALKGPAFAFGSFRYSGLSEAITTNFQTQAMLGFRVQSVMVNGFSPVIETISSDHNGGLNLTLGVAFPAGLPAEYSWTVERLELTPREFERDESFAIIGGGDVVLRRIQEFTGETISIADLTDDSLLRFTVTQTTDEYGERAHSAFWAVNTLVRRHEQGIGIYKEMLVPEGFGMSSPVRFQDDPPLEFEDPPQGWSSLPRRCASDLNSDGVVDFLDLVELLSSWGSCENCSADFNGDGEVDTQDVLVLIARWGEKCGR